MIDVAGGLAESLDLERARRVWRDRGSDFIVPPVVYTAIRANVASFIEAIQADLRSGHYRPSAVRIVDVPKQNHTTRPAGILDVKDRVLYQALVDEVAVTATAKLLGEPTVFGSVVNTDQNADQFLLPGGYTEFRNRVASEFNNGFQHVLESDIAAYFEHVDDKFLQEILIGLGVDSSVVDALISLLAYWSRVVPIGLPQGVWPSDYLGARVYLDRVDKAMLQRGYTFFRYSDDLRVVANSPLVLRKALRDVVTELRGLGLHVQSAKTYLKGPDAVRKSIERLHQRLARREDLAELLDLDPYGYTSAEETLEELDEEEIIRSERLLDALMEEAFGDGTRPDFELCRICITGYRRIKSPNAWRKALRLLMRLPALTDELVRYLRIAVTGTNASAIKNGVIAALTHESTIYAWQIHWLLYLLTQEKLQERLNETDIDTAFKLAVDRNQNWSVRMMAIRLLELVGSEVQARSLRDMCHDESSLDVKHAILSCFWRLSRPERKRLLRLFEGSDPQTDAVISYLRSRWSD